MKKYLVMMALLVCVMMMPTTMQARKFRGMVEVPIAYDVEDMSVGGGVSVSLGSQIKQSVFLGGGIQIIGCYVGNVDMYGECRKYFRCDKKISPYLDFRLGISTGSGTEPYAGIFGGSRFSIARNKGCSVALGLETMGHEDDWGSFTSLLISLRFGFEF